MRSSLPRILNVALFAGIMLLSGCSRPCRTADWERSALRVMTYNLFVDRPNFSVVESILREEEADVVFLQEVTPQWSGTFSRLNDLYPYQNCVADDDGCGNALLARLPLVNVQRLPARFGWHGAWCASVATAQGLVQLLCVHLAPPLRDDGEFTVAALLETGPTHRREIEAFARCVDFDKPLIVLGDFNENENGAAASCLKRKQLRSALSEYDRLTPTWKWTKSALVTGRLDHVFHSKELEATFAAVIPRGVSDHRPVIAAFDFQTKRTNEQEAEARPAQLPRSVAFSE